MLTLVPNDSVKNSDHFDVLCVLIACMVLEIINQMSKNQKSSLIVWNTVLVHQTPRTSNDPQLTSLTSNQTFYLLFNLVCVSVCVCLLLNISLFMCLFVPQTILTFSAVDEGRKF